MEQSRSTRTQTNLYTDQLVRSLVKSYACQLVRCPIRNITLTIEQGYALTNSYADQFVHRPTRAPIISIEVLEKSLIC